MPSVNRVVLVGNLGGEPEIAATKDNRAVCKMSLATNRNWKDKATGEKKQITTWHRLVCFDKLAEICKQYLHSGSLIYAEGRLNTRTWQKDNGETGYMTEIIVEVMQMLDGKKDGYRPPPTTAGPPMSAYTGDEIPF